MDDVLVYWMDLGADGFRMDAVLFMVGWDEFSIFLNFLGSSKNSFRIMFYYGDLQTKSKSNREQ